MRTFLDYEKEFGGANRILIAVMDKNGDMFNQPFFQTMEKITLDAMKIEHADASRVSSIFTPNVRFVEVVEDGFAGGNVIPATFTPNIEGFKASDEQFATIKANIEKAGIVGRLVAKDFSGAMVWVDLVPEDPAHGVTIDYNAINDQLEAIRAKYENEHTTVAVIGFSKMVGDITNGAKSVIVFFFVTIAFTWLLLFAYSASVKLASLTVFCALVAVVWMLGALRLLGFGIDPMNMLTPFLIFAIAVSHGEQMINRFRGELFFGGLEDGSVDELRTRARRRSADRRATRLPHAARSRHGRADRRLHRLRDDPDHSRSHHFRAGGDGDRRRRADHPHRPDPAAGAAVVLPPAQPRRQEELAPAPAHAVRQTVERARAPEPPDAGCHRDRDRRRSCGPLLRISART